ncbi:MAG: hypothetical protein ACRDI0_13740 [Actinomycetota bacterium]
MIDDRFRALKNTASPDLWDDIVHREPRAAPPPSRAARYVAAAVALALAAGGFAVLVRAFGGREAPPRPATTAPAPVDPRVAQSISTGWTNAAVTAFGSLWVTESANDGTFGGSLLRLDPETGGEVARIPVETVPGWESGGEGLAVGDDSIWIGGAVEGPTGPRASLVRVDPLLNEAVETIPVGGDHVADVEVDEEGIWASVFAGNETELVTELVRIDPATRDVVARVPLATRYARNVLLAGGAAWVQERITGGGAVGGSVLARIDPATNEITDRIDFGGSPAKFSVFEDDIYALTNDGFVRIDTATAAIAAEPVPAGEDPVSGGIGENVSSGSGANVAVGAGGLWFIARDHGDLTVSRFVPDTGEIDVSVELPEGATPIAMAVTDDSIWVVDYQQQLTRIALHQGPDA